MTRVGSQRHKKKNGWILLGAFYERFLIPLAIKEFSAFVDQLYIPVFKTVLWYNIFLPI
jgi:hypothetical protein